MKPSWFLSRFLETFGNAADRLAEARPQDGQVDTIKKVGKLSRALSRGIDTAVSEYTNPPEKNEE